MGKYLRRSWPTLYKYYQEIIGEVYYELLCGGFFLRSYSRKKLRRCEEIYENPVETLLHFHEGIGLYRLTSFQNQLEINKLFNIIKDLKPNVICEIGTDMGGTLYLWSKILQENGLMVSIDLPRLYRKSVNRFIRSFFSRSQRVSFIREDSHTNQCFQRMNNVLDGMMIDFLFIDGDHSYEGVRKDFEMYSKFVRSGGIIAFHDITIDDKPDYVCGVMKFWNEVKVCYDYGEIVAEGGCGIGFLYV